MSTYRKKIFPQRLPMSYHGDLLPQKSLQQTYKRRALSTFEANPETQNKKIVNWQLKKTNNDILNERRQFVANTGKISNDTPIWFQSTSDFYRRGELAKLRTTKQSNENSKNYDVFNRRRFSLHDWKSSQIADDSKILTKRSQQTQKAWNVTAKIGQHQSHARSTSVGFSHNSKCEITPKIGTVDVRDYTVRKPQMKIGRVGVIDTYSPF